MELLCDSCIHQKACTKTYATFGRFYNSACIVSCECFSDKEDIWKEIRNIDDRVYYIASKEEYSKISDSLEMIEKVIGI